MTWWTRVSWPGTLLATTDERDRTDRDVHVEDPSPRELLDEHASEERSDDARHAEHGAEKALVTAAVPRRDDVADDRLRPDHQAAAAETLDRPGRRSARTWCG